VPDIEYLFDAHDLMKTRFALGLDQIGSRNLKLKKVASIAGVKHCKCPNLSSEETGRLCIWIVHSSSLRELAG
jgi:hypothetical protein